MSKPNDFSIRCQNCSFNHLCIPVALNQTEMQSLDEIIERKRPLHKNDQLTIPGQKFTSLFAVRTGSFKSYITSPDGEQQITGFHFPGDVVGFDGLYSEKYQSYTQAMETSMVCELPYDKLDTMSAQLPTLRKEMLKIMSTEINQDHSLMMLLNKRTAEERLAHFLINLSDRFKSRGFSPAEFNLTMTRNEIGNHLGLTVETVSRLLTRFQKEQIIKVDGKNIQIQSIEILREKLGEHVANKKACG
ncbi:fumarate/nitrate reduction transcriptional regulator Fnr [Aliiglaciecola lipolytica]|uniref:CRP/FNR family transcriptional regulator, anaerobic regulatory protein n=1 Tax=Aliiglaciecola lipolytica E3 TaxID=1127673 RepID=K6X288_9ALTE|nr:fumarate/nitrate reduction transcriptional regulator Fnr [Aliiglaciecola lipolytica]GAC14769.1 CRP/FNR family transcriptional regulator, anaerobic regulatory protein [Aliiglaciecola lipolytica E3]